MRGFVLKTLERFNINIVFLRLLRGIILENATALGDFYIGSS